jgi:hypothetical protein
MEDSTVVILRALERIISVLIGGFFAWLGFRLFLDVSTKADSSGKFTLPGGSAIHLMRVGPGVFFALFGMAIVGLSYLHPVEAVKREKIISANGKVDTVQESYYNGAIPGNTRTTQSTLDRIQEQRNLQRNQIVMLNQIPDRLKTDLNQSERSSIEVKITKIKLTLMEALWGEDWGDFPAFKEWVNTSIDAAPLELQAAEKFWNSK